MYAEVFVRCGFGCPVVLTREKYSGADLEVVLIQVRGVWM